MVPENPRVFAQLGNLEQPLQVGPFRGVGLEFASKDFDRNDLAGLRVPGLE
jgi:hypothetical protein